MSNVKGVFERKFLSPVEKRPQNGGFGGEGVKSLTFGFVTPKRHVLARNRVFWRILRQNTRAGVLADRRDEEPQKNEQIAE